MFIYTNFLMLPITHHITMIEFYIHKNDIEIMKSEQK